MKQTENIDLGLVVMSNVAAEQPGASFTLEEIADVCESSRPTVLAIERRAIKKLFFRLRELWEQL